MKSLTILILLATSLSCIAQATSINGAVMDGYGTPLVGALIVYYDADGNMQDHMVSDIEGAYMLEVVLNKGDRIEVTHLVYQKAERIITDVDMEIDQLIVDFYLEEQVHAFDEIVFTAKRKLKDTIQFDLENMNLQEDDDLRDILEQVPDVRVGETGNIIYKGKNIDKILVNDKPSFENQNSIALESIEKSIIQGISLINNYSDDFNLDFDEHEESVLNIDTKNNNEKIISGELNGAYGLNQKYDFGAKGLLFSKGLNSFLTHNTNNIGENVITSDELKGLFSEGMPFSSHQARTLSDLFSRDENLNKDFFSNTNLTIRNQTRRLKTSVLLYHLAPSRISSRQIRIDGENNVPLLNSSEIRNNDMNAILGAGEIAFKLSRKTLIGYNFNSNKLRQNASSLSLVNYIDGSSVEEQNIEALGKNDILAINHLISLKSKLKDNLILEASYASYHENTKTRESYGFQGQTSVTSSQNLYSSRKVTTSSVGLRRKYSNAFVSFLQLRHVNSLDKITELDSYENLIGRSSGELILDLNVSGKEVIEGLEYKATAGINPFLNRIDGAINPLDVFIPVNAWAEYITYMHRYYVEFDSKRNLLALESGLDFVQEGTQFTIGNYQFPTNYSTSQRVAASYNYDNLFDGEMVSTKFSYDKQTDVLKQVFLQQSEGIAIQKYFIADNVKDFFVEGLVSKTILPVKYATKLDFSLGYRYSEFPLGIESEEIQLNTTTSVNPGFRAETLSGNSLNLKFASDFYLNRDMAGLASINYWASQNSLTLIYKKNSIKGEAGLFYNRNKVGDRKFSRQNFNMEIEYTKNKIGLTLKARHLFELLSVYDNSAYDTQVIIANGVRTTVVNDQSLSYLILGVKYKL